MNGLLISALLPQLPTTSEPIVHTIYIKESPIWEYKQIIRNLKTEQLMNEEELNKFGKDGWELVSVVANTKTARFYFKRLGN